MEMGYMIILCMLATSAVTIVFYWLLELHYFYRIFISYMYSRFVKKKLHVLDCGQYSSICLTTDVDIFVFHMNNARYLREVDFARADFYCRSGLWRAIRGKGAAVFQGAASVRYRRFIRLFARYYITTRIVYWDSNSIFMEHRFVTNSDQCVRAVVYCQQKVTKCSVDEIMNELLKNPLKVKATGVNATEKPECPPEIRLWVESIEASKAKLKIINMA